MRQLYAPFSRNHEKLVEMDVRSAELTKYAANAMLATRISFMNELANLAEVLGADIEAVRLGIGIGPAHRSALPVCRHGLWRLLLPEGREGADQDRRPTMAQQPAPADAIEKVNEAQKNVLFNKIVPLLRRRRALHGKTIALWGLSFKPNTDDMREAPSLVLIGRCSPPAAKVRAYDPVAAREATACWSPSMAKNCATRC